MTDVLLYLSQPFAQYALVAAILVAIACGLIGPFVIMRNMAFAVHGTSELAFTGAAAGLLLGNNPVLGAFIGAILVAGLIGSFGNREHERDASIGVILAFGLGLGVLLLSFYKGFAAQATNILFGNIFGVTTDQILLLLVVSITTLVVMAFLYRPLLFATLDADVAKAKGVPVTALGIIFLVILALTVTLAAQIVGTLLVLSLAITPAAAAVRLSVKPLGITLLSIWFALLSSVGGLLLSLLLPQFKPSIFICGISFLLYVLTRLLTIRSK